MPDKPDIITQVKSLARLHTKSAIETLGGISSSGESESAKVAASIALLDRGWGKPAQSIEHTGADGGAIEVIIRDLMAEQREKKNE